MNRIDLLKERKEKGALIVLDANRKKNKKSERVLGLLETEALTADEISEKLHLVKSSAYNTARRLERLNKVLAMELDGEIVFIGKKKAEKEGLI